MKRIAVVVVALVVIVVVALPPLFGARARALVESETKSIGEALAPYMLVDVTFDDWDVGLYSSTATVSLNVDIAAEYGPALGVRELPPRFDATLPEVVTVYHGPFLTGTPVGFGWGGVDFELDGTRIPELQDFQRLADVDHLARFGITVGFFGRTAMRVEMPAFQLDADDARIEFAGLEMRATLDGGGRNLDFHGELGGFSLSTPYQDGFDIGRISWSSSSRRMASRFPGLWLGGGRVDVSEIEGSGRGVDVIGATGIGIEGNSDLEGDRYILGGLYEAAEVRIADVVLSDFVTELSLRYDAEIMAQLILLGNDPNELGLEAATELTDAMLRERLEFAVERFSLRHRARSASANLAFEYRGDELPEDYTVDLAMDFTPLLGLVTASLDLVFHRELFRGLGLDQADATARVLAREGILGVADEDYTLDVDFDGGALTMNGEPLDPTELMRLLGGL